jgi:hypothetical protein
MEVDTTLGPMVLFASRNREDGVADYEDMPALFLGLLIMSGEISKESDSMYVISHDMTEWVRSI